MEIIVNGEKVKVKDGAKVKDLFNLLDINEKRVVVEKNRVILRKNEMLDNILQEGDKLEIIQMVGGG
jgi:sulfur carrier protein